MKIAMALENFSHHAGGVESYAIGLATTLINEGWEVHFFGLSWDGKPEKATFHCMRRLPGWFPPSLHLLHFALSHQRIVRKQHFDIVMGFGNTVFMNVYQSHGGVHFLSNMRKIAAVRNPLLRLVKMATLFVTPKYHVRAWIESAPFRSSNRPVLVAISDMVRNDIASYFHVPRDQILLLYNGIDQTKFANASFLKARELRRRLGFDQEVVFLFMAYDLRKKGIYYLIEAAALLRNKVGPNKFGIVVVGSPPYPRLKRLVKRLHLSNMIAFPGPTREPETYYQACDVFVLPTFYDACSLVVFEAMAAGNPVITTAFNGAAGIIADGVEGLVLKDPKDVAALCQAMEAFLDNDFRKLASTAARKRATDYTLENNHREMLGIFETLVTTNR